MEYQSILGQHLIQLLVLIGLPHICLQPLSIIQVFYEILFQLVYLGIYLILHQMVVYISGCYDVNHCPCATQGRVHTDIPSGGIGFGLHAINCTYHPYGALSVKDIEDKFQAKFGDLYTYDAFMDYNMGLWANNLDPFVTHFQVNTHKIVPTYSPIYVLN